MIQQDLVQTESQASMLARAPTMKVSQPGAIQKVEESQASKKVDTEGEGAGAPESKSIVHLLSDYVMETLEAIGIPEN